MIAKIFEFIGSLKTRAVDSKNTTVGGGVLGIGVMALIGQLELASGCKFQEAFMGLDWAQVISGVAIAIFGAMTTDAKKTV
jgi:hypothetical protein